MIFEDPRKIEISDFIFRDSIQYPVSSIQYPVSRIKRQETRDKNLGLGIKIFVLLR